jgi:hypothetical protein
MLIALLPEPAHSAKFICLDLQPKANHSLNDSFHVPLIKENTLESLAKGEQTLAGVKFSIGNSLLQLGCEKLKDKPLRISGIRVQNTCDKLHMLQAVGYGDMDDEGTVVGLYVVHYADDSKESIEIVLGQDTMSWWYADGDKEPTRAKLAWEGENEPSRVAKAKLRLFAATWNNPHPEKKITFIDFVSVEDSPCAPFCVALSLETK